LIDFSNYGFSCAGENNIFQVNDTDGQKSPGSPPPKCGVLSPGY
jgi:hypothetical protein